MRTRIIVSRSLHGGVKTKSGMLNGAPVYANIVSKFGTVDTAEYGIDMVRGLPDKVCLTANNAIAHNAIKTNTVLKSALLTVDGKDVVPLRKSFNFKAGMSFNRADLNDNLIKQGVSGTTLWDELNNHDTELMLSSTAKKMFSNINPLTNKVDVSDAYYTKYIPLVSITGVVPAQIDDNGNSYFNPNGSVSVAEFLDSLNAISSSSNSRENRKASLDNVSSEDDFFNEGYNACLSGMSSPFYRLYKRSELMQPITRAELAYLVVICWRDYISKFGSVTSGYFNLGINTNWGTPVSYAGKFSDGRDYKLYKKCRTTLLGKTTSVDIKDYIGELPMIEFREAMRNGLRGLPLPFYMCLMELDALDLFYFEGMRLNPLQDVTRGELTYFLVKLAKSFPLKFVSSGDNSYVV